MNTDAGPTAESAWALPAMAAALFAIDPVGIRGVILRAQPGPIRDEWLQQLRILVGESAPWRRLPLHIGDDRLLGGLDLSATLQTGRAIVERGILAECDGGILLVAMAERLDRGIAVKVAATLDSSSVALERGGLSQRVPTRIGIIALDEGLSDDEAVPAALTDRLAMRIDLSALGLEDIGAAGASRDEILQAQTRLATVAVDHGCIGVLCQAAELFGIDSLRAPVLALRVARAAAALRGSAAVTEADVTLAAQLVFAGRATQLPPVEQQTEKTPDSTETAPEPTDSGVAQATHSERDDDEDESADPDSRDERVLEATRAAIPPQLMQQLRFPAARRGAARSSAKSSAKRRPARRGRRIGTRPGDPDTGSQINLVETLRAAAPWQRIRRAESAGSSATEMPAIRLRKEDFRINRYEQRAATTSIFTVDASGSSALHRLAEVKGAVELLLAESYQRRDQVALVAFRGQGAELLLPPTRSLVRAKRSLAGLPGGGGTPLAAGIQLALETALGIRRKAETPVIILLTDGRGNVTLDGKADTPRAGDEAMEAARRVRMADITALLVDTSPRPRPMGKLLADAMGAHYLALPYADAHRLQKEASGILQDSSVRKR